MSSSPGEQVLPAAIQINSVWCWEPLKPEETCQVKVTSAEWSGKEWYIEIEALEDAGHMWAGRRSWYDLDWFIQACVLVSPERGA